MLLEVRSKTIGPCEHFSVPPLEGVEELAHRLQKRKTVCASGACSLRCSKSGWYTLYGVKKYIVSKSVKGKGSDTKVTGTLYMVSKSL